jgi:hypothetical protein
LQSTQSVRFITGQFCIEPTRKDYPGKSDHEIAKALAVKYGYIAVVRYKNSRGRSEFTNLGVCNTEAEIQGYMTSPYCHATEVIYDGRSAFFPLNAAHVINGRCETCGKGATRESLQMGAGNDFYFRPKCGLLFCDRCYGRLPLTSSPGYGMCTKCKVQVKRTLPSFFMNQPPVVALHPAARTVPIDLRDEIWMFVNSGEGDRNHLKKLIARCKAYDNGHSVLSEARRLCNPRWPALAKDLDEAIKAWQPPRQTPQQAATPSRGPSERDNVGTRYETEERVNNFWLPYVMRRPKFPFIFYDMREKKDAMDAMLSLPPIKIASDSGKLISTEVLQFGVYPIVAGSEVRSWGFEQITLALYDAAIASCRKYHGTNPRVSDPPIGPPPVTSRPVKSTSASVTFEWEEKVDMLEQMKARGIEIVGGDPPSARIATKHHYKAPNKQAALAFLKANPVDNPFYYLIVHTTEGVFGRDKDGIFEQPT